MMAATAVPQPSFLDAFRQKSAEECLYVDYGFSTTISGINTNGDGEIYIQGNSYHMKGDGVEIYCDGASTWLIDEVAGEVMIESATSKDAGYLANPVLLLMDLEKNAHSYKAEGNKISLQLPNGIELKITIDDMKTVETKKTEDFRPPHKFDSDWIVTDLR